jgi:hypothetical protein
MNWRPLFVDKVGNVRFKRNEIVSRLHRNGAFDLNEIDIVGTPQEDVEQFWQLLGYGVVGYRELSFIRPETKAKVDALAEVLLRPTGGRS